MNAESSEIKRSPFRSGDSVYQGPQQLALAGAVNSTLITPDSVLTVRGPVGVGKTASVIHALKRTPNNSLIARIGRVHLKREDVLELVLNELGVQQMPASGLQRFTTLKNMLTEWASESTDVFIIVEDVERLGTEGLAELESLTAAESGSTPGAHLVLMGTVDMREFLDQPSLARLKQRVLRGVFLEPFSIDETRGYVEHCIKEYGSGDELSFEPGAVDIIHGCSGGVARFINTVAENMIISAGNSGAVRITKSMAREVASDCFGYEHDDTVLTATLPKEAANAATAGETTTINPELPDEAATSLSADDTGSPADLENSRPSTDSLVIQDDAEPIIRDTPAPTPVPGAADEPKQPKPAAADEAETGALDIGLMKQTTDATKPSLPVLTVEPGGAQDIGDKGPSNSEAGAPESAAAGTSPAVEPPPSAEAEHVPQNETVADDRNVAKPGSAGQGDVAVGLNLDEPVSTSELTEAFALSKAEFQDAARKSAESPADDMRVRLEEAPPEAAGAANDNSDTQTRQALDDALRPDTQLMRTLDEEDTQVEDDGPVPIGLLDDAEPEQSGAVSTADTADVTLGENGQQPAEPKATSGKPGSPVDSAAPPKAAENEASGDLGELEITLDASLDEKKKEAEAKLAEERSRREAAAATESEDSEQPQDADDEEQVAKEREQIELVESLSARFSGAKSLEDVVDDKAAETLFGEEFTEMAAAVAAMASAENLDIGDDSPGEAANTQTSVDAADSAPEKAPGELSLVADEAPPGASAEPAENPSATAKPAAPKPAAPKSKNAKPTNAPSAPPAPGSTSKTSNGNNLDSSPSQRLRMVRALSGKSGTPPVPASGKVGEEIVLGNSSRLKVEKPAETKKPHTPVKGPDTNGEFDYIKDDEPKKKGFLSRFRKS